MGSERVTELLGAMSKPIKNNPILASVNGIGFGFAGVALRHAELDADLFVRTHWFKFIFVPVVPIGIYLLSNPVGDDGQKIGGSYYIHRAVQVRGVQAIWGKGAFSRMLWSAWGIAVAIVGVLIALAWAISLAP